MYKELPEDIKRKMKAILVYGHVHDRHAKAFRDEALDKLAKLLLHKYKVREVNRFLQLKGEK